MKLVCISDTHNLYKDMVVPDGDALLVSGDIDITNATQCGLFAQWLNELPHEHKIYVPGNHDTWVEENVTLAKGILENACIMLVNDECVLGDLKVWGSPFTPEFCNWSFMLPRGDEMARIWNQIPWDTDILITHGPRLGVMDLVPWDKVHVGCWDLGWAIDKIQPMIHLFGHIHSGHGKEKIDGITYINASVVNEEYQLVNEAIVIDI